MLHILTSSPFSSRHLETCLRYSSHEDEIILLQDAVLAALNHSESAAMLAAFKGKVYCLKEDAEARGVLDKLTQSVEIADMARFVCLTSEHSQQINWQ
uniref:sulfurtransferase complex subunit TusB n=1 Tax=Thaumasiovibrio occultus TaxID=1891184 RepID=UPI000B34E160|nr:sulfurtransferase complex subunit TusB [Thaumasiovibrio occultus]